MMKRWTAAELMRAEVVAVRPETGLDEVADVLVRHGISAAPVVGDDGTVLGVISEADLLGRLEYADRVPHHPLAVRRIRNRRSSPPGNTAADLMSAPAITVQPGAGVARVARLMEAGRIKRLPVVDEVGRLVGIVSRRDVLRLYARPDPQVRDDVRTALDGVGLGRDRVRVLVDRGVVTLRGSVDRPATVAVAVGLAGAVPGVVDTIDELGIAAPDEVALAAPQQGGARVGDLW
jgi:CBS domain-containing protein